MGVALIGPEAAADLPRLSGVYRFLDAKGVPLYIGKAKDLRARVGTWLRRRRDEPAKAGLLRRWSEEVAFTVTRDEEEALLLEASEIRRWRPRYNVALKDDKSYPWLRLVPDPWPYLALARGPDRPGRSIGPFTSARAVRETIRFLERRFGVRPCRYDLSKGTVKACVYYRMRQCPAPCEGKVGREEYGEMVAGALDFLSGDPSDTLEVMAREMEDAAARREYELAAQLRDRVRALGGLMRVKEEKAPPRAEVDLVALARGESVSVFGVRSLRKGRQTAPRTYPLEDPLGEPWNSVLERVLAIAYADRRPPRTVLVPAAESRPFPLLEATLGQGRKVRIRPPRWIWEKARMAEAEKDARIQLERLAAEGRRAVDPADERALKDLDRRLGLGSLPRRIEGFDVANLQGEEPVASRVVFTDGRYDKSGRRLYRIRDVTGPHDPAMIAEAVGRRCRRLAERGGPMPDLILVDGGKTQVAAARGAVEGWFLPIPVVGLAKRQERVVAGDPPEYLDLPERSPGRHLLMRVRDEAHRVANSFHRDRRSKGALGQA